MKKLKFTAVVLAGVMLMQNVAFAGDEYEEFYPAVAYSAYSGYEHIDAVVSGYYSVSNGNGENSKAIFYKGEQKTDFIFNSVYNEADIIDGFIVSRIEDGTEKFALIPFERISDEENTAETEINYYLPFKYKKITIENLHGSQLITATDFDGNDEYYIRKDFFLADKESIGGSTYDIDYEDCGELIRLKSRDDVPNPNPPKAIEGLDGCYILDEGVGATITDVNGKAIVNSYFRSVEDKLGAGDTLKVRYAEGMSDSSAGVLNKNLEPLIPAGIYYNADVVTEGNATYISAYPGKNGVYDYYDLDGNLIDDLSVYLLKNSGSDVDSNVASNEGSQWARREIGEAVHSSLVPLDLQNNYTAKITRLEFCRLAMQTYKAKYTYNVDFDNTTPFSDVDDTDVTMAYRLGIVSGTGGGKFTPDAYITRQEAAVILNNMAEKLNLKKGDKAEQSFVDESYFADWAKNDIYEICRYVADDGTAVMTGTGNGKFSPWYNYTREQAIATMNRLYKCGFNIDYRSEIYNDIKTIGDSYSIGGFNESLLAPENLEKYYKKWDAIAETPEQKSYVSNLEYDMDTGVLYYTKMLDYLLENGGDKAELEKIYKEKLNFFADLANGSNDVIMNLHATSLEETFGEKYGKQAEEFALNY